MKAIWSLFTQAVTVMVAAYFVITTLRPDWLHQAPKATGAQTTILAQNNLSLAAQTAAPAVVAINTHSLVSGNSTQDWLSMLFGQPPSAREQNGLGSGVIVDAQKGLILTNHHVVTDADQVVVTLADGRQAAASVLGDDPETDLAVIQIRLPALQAIELGDSNDLKLGESVLAIGNPFGIGLTVTAGIVSALGRTELGINTFENFIQTDAAINPGNSGGALVNTQGQLVGINTAIYSQSGGSMGIGFAIPTSLASQVSKEIVERGFVVRGWLGIEPQSLTPELAQALGSDAKHGIVVAAVMQPGPAASAGIRPGDIISALGDQPIHSVPEMLTQVAQARPGQVLTAQVWRQKSKLQLPVKIAQRPKANARLGR